jgi:hypothetical protein
VSEDEKPDVTDTDNVTDHDSPADGNFEDHNYEDDDLKPDVTHKSKGKKTAKAKTPKATPKKAATPRKNAGASPRKPMAWTPEEDWALFSAVHPKIEKPAWDAVAAAVGGGRDGKVSLLLFVSFPFLFLFLSFSFPFLFRFFVLFLFNARTFGAYHVLFHLSS